MKRFVLLGAAGFVAPRHMRAIKETGIIWPPQWIRMTQVGILAAHIFQMLHSSSEFEELSDLLGHKPIWVNRLTISRYAHQTIFMKRISQQA